MHQGGMDTGHWPKAGIYVMNQSCSGRQLDLLVVGNDHDICKHLSQLISQPTQQFLLIDLNLELIKSHAPTPAANQNSCG